MSGADGRGPGPSATRMRYYRSLTALAVCLPLATLSGCGGITGLIGSDSFSFTCPAERTPGLAIAVGARANSPEPGLPPEIRQLIVASMNGCGKITVVRVDGRPAVAGSSTFTTGAKTKQNFDIDQQNFRNHVIGMVQNARAQEPEANVLQALSIASDAAGEGGTVV